MIGVESGDRSLAPMRDELIGRLIEARVASRLGARDATLWGPEAEAEARIRLDWVVATAEAEAIIAEVEALRAELQSRGIDRVVLCGMGGSSLAPEVICQRYAVALEVLDSTHPTQVARALHGALERTVVVVASKSGGTIETRSHLLAFEAAYRNAGLDPAAHIVIVTDPGSPLDDGSSAKGYRVFRANPNVGGRFSALTAFGLVPSGLAGANVRELVAEAAAVREQLIADIPSNPALQLTSAIICGLPERYAIVLHECENEPAGISAWIEQLVAESTGKNGQGVLPVAISEHSPEAHQTSAPASSLVINLEWLLEGGKDLSDRELEDFEVLVYAPLGAQLLLWEFATAMLGHCMGVDPFNQPDVESAKVAARKLLDAPRTSESVLGELSDMPRTSVVVADHVVRALNADDALAHAVPQNIAELQAALEASIPSGGYLAIQAYLDRSDEEVSRHLVALRDVLADRLGVPVTLGWGPRFLHSTGQLHKGGPALGVFLQLLDSPAADLPIAASEMTFGQLISAQAAGDRNVLAAHGRPVIALRMHDAHAIASLL